MDYFPCVRRRRAVRCQPAASAATAVSITFCSRARGVQRRGLVRRSSVDLDCQVRLHAVRWLPSLLRVSAPAAPATATATSLRQLVRRSPQALGG